MFPYGAESQRFQSSGPRATDTQLPLAHLLSSEGAYDRLIVPIPLREGANKSRAFT